MNKLKKLKAIVQQLHQGESSYAFSSVCHKNLVNILPILLKVKDKFLNLVEYQLNPGLCSAIAAGLKVYPDFVENFAFVNNNMKDEDLAQILMSMQFIKHPRSLSYKKN